MSVNLHFFLATSYSVAESQPGPSKEVPINEIIRTGPERVGSVIPSEIEDSDDSIADPSYEIKSGAGGLQHHIECDNSRESSNTECSEHRGRAKKGRKRKYIDQNRTQKKVHKDSNKTYFNYRGRKIEPKPFSDFRCGCPKKCSERICSEKRKEQFDRFWSLGSYNAQTSFIAAAVTEYPKQRQYGRSATKKTFSRRYKLDGEIICRNTFVKTLGVSTFRVNTALKKFHGRSALTDQRGNTGGKNKLPDTTVQKVIDQINRIPRYISHYSRSTTEANFLPPEMTIQKMYNLYCSEEIAPVSIATYKRIFYSKFNLKTKSLKKDTCNTCDKLKIAIDNENNIHIKEELKEKQKTHLEEAQEAQNLRKRDFEMAKENDEIECLTFDLEKTLPLPRIPTNIVFYKRQLWVYNAGVHSAKNDRGYCYVWVEGMAGRGSQEVGSCLFKHIKCYLPTTVKHLTLWSDACGGQNRNIKITLFLKSILHTTTNLQTITMNFLMSGHSFLPNDTDFSDIESELKRHQRLYTPDDYINIMKTCRKKKPLIVTKMESNDFFGVEEIEKHIVNRKMTQDKEKINWLHIRSIRLDKDEPFHLFIKQHKFTSNFQKVNIKKNIRGRPFANGTPYESLVPLWPQGKPIALPKLQNLHEMIHLIPSDALQFYSNLKGNKRIIEDVDGFDIEQLDFDVENDESL